MCNNCPVWKWMWMLYFILILFNMVDGVSTVIMLQENLIVEYNPFQAAAIKYYNDVFIIFIPKVIWSIVLGAGLFLFQRKQMKDNIENN